ncbi:MAG: 2-C-methyl-D-erythritol 4-phosphate cytidylyltransferase [Ignavibacteria bacterium]
MRTFVIIPAGGTGTRCGGTLPKQYVKINGKEIIAYTLDIFQQNPLVDDIIIAARDEFRCLIDELAVKYNFGKLKKIVQGGKERQDSVYNALSSVSADNDDLAVVHDVARPLLSQELLTEAILTARDVDNVLVALKARDTLVKGDGFIDSYLDRENVFYAQTPQIFKYHILKEAMDKAYSDNFIGTDESMLVARAGYKVKLVEGSILNFKVTTKTDIDILQSIWQNK